MLAGFLLGWFLRSYPEQVLAFLHQMGHILHIEVLKEQIAWMRGAPAGMKLNEDLNKQLATLILRGIDFWDSITTFVSPHEPVILKWISWAGIFGASFILALASDLLSLVTVHVDLVRITPHVWCSLHH